MNKYWIGIDVGKNGGLAIIESTGEITVAETPYIGTKPKHQIDKKGLYRILEPFSRASKEPYEVVVVIEDVHSIFGSSAKSNFQFGRALGILEGLVEGMKISYVKVQPKEWQKLCFQGVDVIKKVGKTSNDTKAMALIAAQRLYPNVNLLATTRSKVPHDGIVDSLLMAHYAKLKL